jgi:hypothetical protein
MVELSMDEINAASGAVDWTVVGEGLILIGSGVAVANLPIGATIAVVGGAMVLFG